MAGLGHYNITSAPTKLGGDLAGVNVVQVATYGDCCLAVSADGSLFGWGNSEYLQLASVTDSTQVRGHLSLAPGGFGKGIKNIEKRLLSRRDVSRAVGASPVLTCLLKGRGLGELIGAWEESLGSEAVAGNASMRQSRFRAVFWVCLCTLSCSEGDVRLYVSAGGVVTVLFVVV